MENEEEKTRGSYRPSKKDWTKEWKRNKVTEAEKRLMIKTEVANGSSLRVNNVSCLDE